MRKIGIIAAILAGFTAGVVLTANFNAVPKAVAEASGKLPEVSQVFADVAEKVMPSVVTITSEKVYEVPVRSWEPFWNDPFFDFFFGPRWRPRYRKKRFKQEGLGSGVIVSEDGYILTNAHVVDGADELRVHIGDREYEADIVGVDEKTDLAVLKVDADEKLPAAKLGDSDKIRVGEWVLAIGSPFRLEHTVTAGIISAKGRSRMGIADYEDFIQTDAAINPGNSGGALVNLRGEVIGINTAIVSSNGGNVGIGFAIPINLAKQVMEQLIEHGRVVRGWLGIMIQDVTEDLAEALDLAEAKGVLVSSVLDDSPAEEAGLERGDVIVALDGKKVESVDDLRTRIASTPPGTKVKLDIIRNGKRKRITVELGEMPTSEEVASAEEGVRLGLRVKSLTRYDAHRLGYDGDLGVLVTDVEEGSIAYRAGVQPNDVIVELNREAIYTPADLRDVASQIRKGDPVLFVVWRDGNFLYLATRA